MGTVVGQALDYLVASLAAPAVAAQSDCVIVDGTTNDDLSRSVIWLGRYEPEDMRAASAARDIPVIGRRRIDETWTITGFVDCRRDGTAQKTSRDAAISLFDVICHLISIDPTLGGILTNAWYVTMPTAEIIQPDPSATGESRTVFLFSLEIRSRYAP